MSKIEVFSIIFRLKSFLLENDLFKISSKHFEINKSYFFKKIFNFFFKKHLVFTFLSKIISAISVILAFAIS